MNLGGFSFLAAFLLLAAFVFYRALRWESDNDVTPDTYCEPPLKNECKPVSAASAPQSKDHSGDRDFDVFVGPEASSLSAYAPLLTGAALLVKQQEEASSSSCEASSHSPSSDWGSSSDSSCDYSGGSYSDGSSGSFD